MKLNSVFFFVEIIVIMIYMSESDFLMLILLLFFSSWVIGVDVTVVVIIHSGSAGGVWHCAKQQQQRWQTHTEWRQETFEFRSNPETDTMRIKKNDYGYKVWNVSESERERKKNRNFVSIKNGNTTFLN